jgi:transcriptional regulator with XRE-family HTH domain
MPRPPSRPSVLRTARRRLGLTQLELARLVHCSKITIEKFENGTAGMSQDLARRIALELNLSLQQLLSNSTPESPVGIRGEPVTAEGYSKWKLARALSCTKEQVDKERAYGAIRRTLLLDAAVGTGKYHLVAMVLDQKIDELVKEFGLEKAFAAEYKLYGIEDDSTLWADAMAGGFLERFERKRDEIYAPFKPPPG